MGGSRDRHSPAWDNFLGDEMPTVRRVKGETITEMSKSEVRRFLEATYLAMAFPDYLEEDPDCPLSQFVALGRQITQTYGEKHLDEGGELAETQHNEVVQRTAPQTKSKKPEPLPI